MKKILFSLVILLVVGATVFSGPKRDNSISTSSPLIINFYTNSEGSGSTRSIDSLISTWNAKNNGIRVEAHYTPNDDYDDRIKILVASSTDVDAFWIRNPAPAQQYIAQNALADLTGYARESGLDLSPIRDSALKGATKDGKFYGLPTTGSCWMIFYNKALFDARGIPYPINLTWDQYLDLAKRLTYTDGSKKYWGGVCPPWVLNLGASAGGEYLTAQDLPLTRRYLEVLYRMYVEDHSHFDIGEMSAGTFDINSTFAAGNVYMMINGDWTFSLLDAPFEYAAAPLPIFPGMPQNSSVGSLGFYSVSAKSPHPGEAYKFIEWALTSEEGTAIIVQNGGVPCYPTKSALEAYKKVVTVPGVEYRFSSLINQEQTTEPYYAQLQDAFTQEAELYLIREQDINKTFTNFLNLRKEIISNF
jgi:ABC-type glycerol-3-phosphate transport system substrate-binding protein